MSEPLWQLPLKNAVDLNCKECFAVMEFSAGLLVRRGGSTSRRIAASPGLSGMLW